MAKQKAPNNQKGTTSVVTNSFIKGMNKDITQAMEPNQSWWHARNAANNSNDGDMGVIGNEPANLQCGVIPYTVIGAIHRYGDEWIIFSTDNFSSEIGRFDDSECKYTTLINDTCLGFNKEFLITGASKENFDCTWQVYWDDSNNPSRSLNIDDIPYIQYISSPAGDPCIIYSDFEPLQLNCEKIRLAPLVSTPCVELTKATDGGMLMNGSYQAFIAYTENEQRVTDYIGISNIQTLWSHRGTDSSLNVSVSNLDLKFEYYELALLVRNQGQTYAKRVGLYSTQRKDINIDYLDDSLVPIDIKVIPQRSPAYEKSEAMYVVNDWLLRQGPVEQFDFNYQPIANNIKVNFVVNQISSEYYHLGGNKLGFLRDEQYAFFIRWIYNTGERSSSYHIPGREAEYYSPAEAFENVVVENVNALDPAGDPVFKIWNTGVITSEPNITQPDGSLIIARGKMGYWESTERYPINRPDIWGDLCGKPIRHHKMPAEDGGGFGSNSPLHISNTNADSINLLGVEFTNIGQPVDNDGVYLTNVVGYEILRGSRGGAKSILAKGLFRNMRKYTVPDSENLIGGTVQGLYPNYPYNDLRPDMYFHDGTFDDENVVELNRTEGCDNFSQSVNTFKPLGSTAPIDGEPSGYSRDVFTFSSPDLMFTKPFLNAYETRIYGDLNGQQSGSFKASEDHPQFKLLRVSSAVVAAAIGIGYAIHKARGDSGFTNYSGSGQATIPADISLLYGTGTTYTGVAAGASVYGSGVSAGIGAAGALAFQSAQNTMALVDLWAGGMAVGTLETAYTAASYLTGIAPGSKGGGITLTTNQNTSESNLPVWLKVLFGVLTTGTNIAIGGDEIIELIYNLVKKSDFVYKYNSYGQFTDFTKRNTGLWRIKNLDSNYIGQSFQSFDSGKYKINNLFRPSTVAVSLSKTLSEPSVQDKSRFVVGGEMLASGSTVNNYFSDSYLLDPSSSRKTSISAYYGALKYNFDNQYGQLDGIKQIPMRDCVNYLDPEKPDEIMYSSNAIFAGDIFITRYTEKVIMPIFSQYLLGQPDEFTYDYSNHVNIPYPRYWLNSQKFEMTRLAQAISTFNLSESSGENGISDTNLNALFPNDLFYLDRGNDSCGGLSIDTVFGTGVGGADPNPKFAMRYAYMYSHSNGILDFFVESEINLAHRDWEDSAAKRIYDIYEYNDLTELFHAQIEKIDNFYKYDESLSPSKLTSQITSFGQIQPRYYDPYVAANCYVSRPKRLIYSLQAQHESKKDFWRVFLNFNYKDFKNKVSIIKPINKSGAIVFFPYLSPQMFQGLDTLKTGLDTKITIGDGGLFSQPFQNITNSDLSNEYGSCESLRGVMNTPMGIFYISQAQGKIFHYAGQGLDPISNKGMKWWFNKYLPSQLIKQYPELEYSKLSDNAVVGIGCQSIYDPNDDIAYFMKKDYRVKSEWVSTITYSVSAGFILESVHGKIPIILGDPIYFDDASWTISYDPKAKAWISFHDWHPEFSIPSINHFFTTKTISTDVPLCPPGYNFNPSNGLCEQAVNTTANANIDVSDIVSTITGGGEDCKLDIVIAMDWSGSTGTPLINCVTGSTTAPPGVQITRASAQLRWLHVFLNNTSISDAMSAGTMQVGFQGWGSSGTRWMQPGNISMSNTVTPEAACNWYTSTWPANEGTHVDAAIGTTSPTAGQGGLAQLNDKPNSSFASQYPSRLQNASFKQILIVVTDGGIASTGGYETNVHKFQTPNATNAGPTVPPNQDFNIGWWAENYLQSSPPDSTVDSRKQEIYAIYCGATSSTPSSSLVLNNISNTKYDTNTQTPGPYQLTMSANLSAGIDAAADEIAGNVCAAPITCTCPTGYALVYPNPATNLYTDGDGVCNYERPPICRQVTCSCPASTIPNSITTVTGTCPDSAPGLFAIGDPNWVNPDPRLCNYFYYDSVPANYDAGTLWRHNSRCDSYANYYNIQYPWEIELVTNTGQTVNTVRSMEYQMEAYVYKNDPGFLCGDDKWEDLNFNFDQSVIYNNEQVSGLLQLTPTPFNNPILELTYPIINGNSINILCSKVEQKYRFNQFWDITNDRGEFTNVEQPIWDTESNGYIKNLNFINLNYLKSPLQHKKFRHYFTNVILRKMDSGSRKMLLRLNNTKLLTSLR